MVKTPLENIVMPVETRDESQSNLNLFQIQKNNKNPYLEELILLAFNEINDDRLEHGLTPVKLGANLAAQNHADDMMSFAYFSHWNANGVKPYVTYTEFGGRNYVKENIATSWCEGYNCEIDPMELIKKFQHLMVYDDANSDWGHRDNILDPYHTHVNIGLVWDDNRFYFVQHFETKLINYDQVNLEDNILRISGKISNGYDLKSINIYEDNLPLTLNGNDLESKSPYNQNFYNGGKLVGVLLETPALFEFYEECQKGKILIILENKEQCISYTTYDIDFENNTFEITADVSKLLNSNKLHTIYINLENQDGERVIGSSITLEYI